MGQMSKPRHGDDGGMRRQLCRAVGIGGSDGEHCVELCDNDGLYLETQATYGAQKNAVIQSIKGVFFYQLTESN